KSVLPSGAPFDHLFVLATFTVAVSRELLSMTEQAAVTRDLPQNVFGTGMMRIRKLPTEPAEEVVGRRSNQPERPSAGGFLTGDISNPILVSSGNDVVFDRAALARGRGRHAFGQPGDGGRPVLSNSRALLGFIIGRDSTRTLLLAAEDLVNEMGIRFLTRAPRPGLQIQTIRARRAA
ncbi:hypothetical protein, partial [Phenylobacterium sp.]|uniref:hypothetical protein n=1 Tax=Phenylobacterium sp. TaxID=1871053 RepID=UPI0037C5B4D6